MKGQEPEQNLITLLPTEKLRKTFHENIESYVKAFLKEKTLSRKEMEQILGKKLLEMTYPNSEYDILLFRKVAKSCKTFVLILIQETSTIYHFESKKMTIGETDEKSLEQLKYVQQ